MTTNCVLVIWFGTRAQRLDMADPMKALRYIRDRATVRDGFDFSRAECWLCPQPGNNPDNVEELRQWCLQVD